MKILKAILVTILLFFSFSLGIAKSEVIQLISESTMSKADSSYEYNTEQLHHIQDVKNVLINFLKVPISEKEKLLAVEFKKNIKDVKAALANAFSKEAYSKVDIGKIEYSSGNRMVIKTNVYWEDEGYSGLQTYFFMFVKEEGSWKISWLVF